MSSSFSVLVGLAALAAACSKVPIGSIDEGIDAAGAPDVVGIAPVGGDAPQSAGPDSGSGSADSASTPAPDAAGPVVDVPPPVMQGGCEPNGMCWQLRIQYAADIDRARSCSPQGVEACGFKVLDSLGCGRCEIWVNDDSELAPLRARFEQAGCDRCFFTTRSPLPGASQPARCPDIVCAPLGAPKCTVPASIGGGPVDKGYCDSATLPTCPAGVMTGVGCSGPYQYCFGGAHNACQCRPGDPLEWSCF